MQVSMVNPFQLNSMETQSIPSATPLAPFRHSTSRHMKSFLFVAQAKVIFHPLTNHKHKTVVTHPLNLYLICKHIGLHPQASNYKSDTNPMDVL